MTDYLGPPSAIMEEELASMVKWSVRPVSHIAFRRIRQKALGKALYSRLLLICTVKSPL